MNVKYVWEELWVPVPATEHDRPGRIETIELPDALAARWKPAADVLEEVASLVRRADEETQP